MTIEEAISNINVVVSNAKMTREEHRALQESIKLIYDKCQKKEKDENDGEDSETDTI